MGKRSSGSKNDRLAADGTGIVHERDVIEWCERHPLTIAAHLMQQLIYAGTKLETIDSIVRSFAGRRVGVLRAIAALERRGWLAVTRRPAGERWEFRSLAVHAERAHELN